MVGLQPRSKSHDAEFPPSSSSFVVGSVAISVICLALNVILLADQLLEVEVDHEATWSESSQVARMILVLIQSGPPLVALLGFALRKRSLVASAAMLMFVSVVCCLLDGAMLLHIILESDLPQREGIIPLRGEHDSLDVTTSHKMRAIDMFVIIAFALCMSISNLIVLRSAVQYKHPATELRHFEMTSHTIPSYESLPSYSVSLQL